MSLSFTLSNVRVMVVRNTSLTQQYYDNVHCSLSSHWTSAKYGASCLFAGSERWCRSLWWHFCHCIRSVKNISIPQMIYCRKFSCKCHKKCILTESWNMICSHQDLYLWQNLEHISLCSSHTVFWFLNLEVILWCFCMSIQIFKLVLIFVT